MLLDRLPKFYFFQETFLLLGFGDAKMNNTQAGRVGLEEKLGPRSGSGVQMKRLKFFKE